MADILPFHPIRAIDDVKIWQHENVTLWHTPGYAPVLHIEECGVALAVELPPAASRGLSAALLLTRIGMPERAVPVEILLRDPNRQSGAE